MNELPNFNLNLLSLWLLIAALTFYGLAIYGVIQPIMQYSLTGVVIHGVLLAFLVTIAFIDYPHPFYVFISSILYYFALYRLMFGLL